MGSGDLSSLGTGIVSPPKWNYSYVFRLNEYQDNNQAMENTTDGFTWVGQTLKEFHLKPLEERNIPLTVCFDRPGVYNINNLAVFVTYSEDSSEMTLQKQTKPSVIVINDVS